jgi:pimeloyl-ACP methyl ester carboxylesterase
LWFLCVLFAAPLSAQATMVRATTNTGISYDVRGQGAPVVLIHGAVLDRRMWDYEDSVLAARFRVIRYDLRGHGASADISAPFDASDDLLAVLDAVGVPRAHLVGLSAGSRIALDFALTHADRVDRLVLASPFPSGSQMTERATYMDSLGAALQRGDVERGAVVLAGSRVMQVPSERADWVRGIVVSNARLFRQSPTAERRLSPPALGRLAEVRARTLIIVGERDSRDILRAADTLAVAIKGARRETVPGALHLVNLWAPELFTRLVTDFLSAR